MTPTSETTRWREEQEGDNHVAAKTESLFVDIAPGHLTRSIEVYAQARRSNDGKDIRMDSLGKAGVLNYELLTKDEARKLGEVLIEVSNTL